MLWIYSPHWAPAKYEGEWVEFPEHTPACYTDPKWGENPDMAYDCGKPLGEIWKYAWAGMKDKWPVAYKVAKNYTIDAAELNTLSGEVDLDGKTMEGVAAAWIAANEAKWKAWAQVAATDGGAAMRPAALVENLVPGKSGMARADSGAVEVLDRFATRPVKLSCRGVWKVFGHEAAGSSRPAAESPRLPSSPPLAWSARCAMLRSSVRRGRDFHRHGPVGLRQVHAAALPVAPDRADRRQRRVRRPRSAEGQRSGADRASAGTRWAWCFRTSPCCRI